MLCSGRSGSSEKLTTVSLDNLESSLLGDGARPGPLPPSSGRQAAPHPAAKPDSSHLAHPIGLSVPQVWLNGLAHHPPSVPMKTYAVLVLAGYLPFSATCY